MVRDLPSVVEIVLPQSCGGPPAATDSAIDSFRTYHSVQHRVLASAALLQRVSSSALAALPISSLLCDDAPDGLTASTLDSGPDEFSTTQHY